MSFAFFPTFYEDELVYSVLARFYVQGGYPAYILCAEDIFINKKVRPDMEFLNFLKPEILEALCGGMSMGELVERHTMFPYYARFLPYERRGRAFEALCKMGGDYNNLLAIPTRKNGEDKCLRYCPLCVEQDRRLYGEAYWHRSHQMVGVSVCPVHGCRLLNSSVVVSGKASPCLTAAEQNIKGEDTVCVDAVVYGSEVERRLARYVEKVFQSKMDMENKAAVGRFLHASMSGTKYLSVRGEQRNIKKLYEDFAAFYQLLSVQGLTELWQIQKVLDSHRFNCFEICQLAMFLNVPPEKLCSMELPDRTQEQIFDDKVRELHKQGLKYPEIAKKLNASYNIVKSIGGGRYGKYSYAKGTRSKCGAKPKDWGKIDRESLPSVKEAVRQLWGCGDVRPRRVTEATVCRMLGFPDKRLRMMPLCRDEVIKYQETQEQYWAREIIWAAGEILSAGQTFNWRQLRTLTNMKKKNALSCLPYLEKLADSALYEQIRSIIL